MLFWFLIYYNYELIWGGLLFLFLSEKFLKNDNVIIISGMKKIIAITVIDNIFTYSI